MKTRKRLQASAFSFIALNVVEKAVLHIFLIRYLIKKDTFNRYLPKQSTSKENLRNTKKIN